MSRNTLSFKLQPADNARLAKLCGTLDSNLKLLAETLAVTIRRRGETFTVSGEGAARSEEMRRSKESCSSATRPRIQSTSPTG